MLYFCTEADITNIFQTAPRYDTAVTQVRQGVTGDINRFMRRNLEYGAGIIEYFTVNIQCGGSHKHFVDKRTIETGTVDVRVSRFEDWTDDDTIVDPTTYEIDTERGWVRLTGNLCGPARIMYNGGYKATETDVLNGPPELRAAAVNEAVYRLRNMLNVELGNAVVDRKIPVSKRKLVGGLLPETAATFSDYRKLFV